MVAPAMAEAPATTPRPPKSGAHASILFVCTGNVCRSAYGEHGLRHRLSKADPLAHVDVTSAGTGTHEDLRVPERLVQIAGTRGVWELGRHRPTALSTPTIDQADLILTATEEHLREVLRRAPRAMNRVFTILELAALVRAMEMTADSAEPFEPGAGTAALARHASRHRPLARASGADLNLEDPFRGPDAGYTRMADLMDPALDDIASALRFAEGGITPTRRTG